MNKEEIKLVVNLRRIYYDNETGNVVISIVFAGFMKVTTVDQDITNYKVLSERNRDTFDVIELEYGRYAQDFAESNGYRVDPDTKKIEFSYPDPNEEELQEPVYQKPLSEQINELEDKTDQAIMELTMTLATGGMA